MCVCVCVCVCVWMSGWVVTYLHTHAIGRIHSVTSALYVHVHGCTAIQLALYSTLAICTTYELTQSHVPHSPHHHTLHTLTQSQIYMMEQEKRRMELEVSRMLIHRLKCDRQIKELHFQVTNEKRKRKKEQKKRKVSEVVPN